jgi:hypothetical protein
MSARTIAGSVATNVGWSARQLQLIPVENCTDCWFMGFRLQALTVNDPKGVSAATLAGQDDNTRLRRVNSLDLGAYQPLWAI